MDAVILGLIGAMVLGAVLVAVLLGKKSRRPAASTASKPHSAHVPFSSLDNASHLIPPNSDDDTAGRLAGAAISLAERAVDVVESNAEHGRHAHAGQEPSTAHETHRHSPLDSLVDAAGVSLPDSSPAPSSDSGSSSYDSGGSSDSGSSSGASSD